jgi:inorganic triphosphatase YgiF
MSTDPGSPAGLDWTEREARFVVENDQYQEIRDTLDGKRKIGSYVLGKSKVRQHDDTYFDKPDYGLHELGWSLRIRRREDTTKITLKIPDSAGDDETPGGSWHREIENTDHRDFAQVFEKIIELLQRQHIVRGGKRERDVILDAAAWNGARYALETAGLRDLFTVRTARHAWPVIEAGREVAELSLDDSDYLFQQVRRDESERQCRLEVELSVSAPDGVLPDIGHAVRSTFGIEEVRISKFEHGMILYRVRKLDEKFEVKLSIPRQPAYEEIVRAIRTNSGFVPGYLFTGDGSHRLRDVYFDTSEQDLFWAGCYLRLRRDGERRDLKFRILSFNSDVGQAAQYEIAAKDTESEFPDRWDQIQTRLSSMPVRSAASRPESLERIERTLAKMGLNPVLEVDVDRIGWSVQKGGSRGELIARLKYDKITYREPGARYGESEAEFEVAGAEEHDAAPRALRVGEYYNFLRDFMDQCRDAALLNEIGWVINAKYFAGMIRLGLHKEIPGWYGTLRVQASSWPMRREPPANSPEPYVAGDPGQPAVPGRDSLVARTGEAVAGAGSSGDAGRSVTVNNHISVAQAQSAQVNANFGEYGQALLGELNRALAYVQSTAPETAPDIEAVRQAVLEGDPRSLRSKLQALGTRFLDITQQISLPVLTALIENRLGLHS